MARVLLYYAHPGHRFSQVNRAMWAAAQRVEGITRVDLYAAYPRFNIDLDREQARLRAHDVILFQHPLLWYSTPALVKEWQDLVLEHGFAYGKGGTALAGKALGQAITAAGPEEAYSETGYQRHPLRRFLAPMEQTAELCGLHVDVESLQHFAEFGVVMMLFLVGLELEPRRLWAMRAQLRPPPDRAPAHGAAPGAALSPQGRRFGATFGPISSRFGLSCQSGHSVSRTRALRARLTEP